tara:strand:+ start:329 stop:442 length:114 start_codon:yes stop_codon:yes gene_type:complete
MKNEFAETIKKTEDTILAVFLYSLPFIVTSFVYLAIR